MKPLIVINLKTYKQGNQLLKLVKTIESVDKDIIIGVQNTNIYKLSQKTKLKIFAQHVDPQIPGRNTGFILPESVKSNGAIGVFLNHSEHKLDYKTIKETIKHCKKIKLKIMLFANSLKQAKKLEKLKPDYVIYEPPELVAGKTSVSESKPDLIKKIKKSLKSKFLVGAGVHSYKDIEIATKLGAKGVILSSAVTTAKNPKKVLKELIK